MATETKRQRQIAEMIKRNFSIVLQQESSYLFKDVLVTVTSVKMSSDMGLAKIYLSVYNTENKQEPILEMEAQNAHLRQALAHRIRKHIRRIPHINFYLDETLDEMYRLGGLFNKLRNEKQMGNEEE